jgi:lipoprotein-releasing system permease protein
MRLADSLWTEWKIALRFLLDNRMQTLLIMFGIAVGSAVIVFITALITGLQANVVERTLGTQAHIRILPPDEVNRILPADHHSWPLVLESPRAQRLRSIINWQDVRDVLDQDAQILAVSPVISGPAIARRGVARASVALLGIDPPRYQRIIPLADDLIAGQFTVGAGHAVIGKELARDLGLGIGDKLRLDAGEGREAVVDIAGIFELGVRELDARYVYLDLKQAQTLLDLPGGVTVIDTTVAEIFEADQVAERLARLTGLRAESWMETNGQLLNALASQSMTTEMIRVFVGISVAFGIASVLAPWAARAGRSCACSCCRAGCSGCSVRPAAEASAGAWCRFSICLARGCSPFRSIRPWCRWPCW